MYADEDMTMLNDAQHNQLKKLLRQAIEGEDWHIRRFAIEDAARIVGATYIKNFVNPSGMKTFSGESQAVMARRNG